MEVRRAFVPCLARVRKGLGLAVLCAAGLDATAAASRIEPRLHARALAPGEVVRLEVVTDGGAERLTGTFGGAPLAFVEAARRPDGVTWIAWAAIPLDAPAGGTSYEVTATDAAGAKTTARAEATIAAKTFPEQRLEVESKFVNPPKAALVRIERERKRLNAVYGTRSTLDPPAAPFVRPVPGDPTSEFGTRRIFNGEPRSPHPGIDLRAATGTPVAAAGPGRVALAADLYYSGGTVILDHGGGLFTIYAHLSKIEAKEGAVLRAGDRVGLSGATGRVTGPHLHWGARVGAAIFDPRALLDPRVFGGATPSPSEPDASPAR